MAQPRSGSFLRDSKWVNLLLLVPVVVVVWLALTGREDGRGDIDAQADTRPSAALVAEDMPAVAGVVEALWVGRPAPTALPSRFSDRAHAVFVSARSQGRRLYSLWETQGTTLEALESALARTREDLGERAREVDTLELALSHSYRALDPEKDRGQLLANVHRGIRGLELSFQDRVGRYSPTQSVSMNRSNERWIEEFRRKHSLSEQSMKSEVRYRTFEADQVLVSLGEPTSAHLMMRGNQVVPVEDVTQANVQRLADLAVAWLVANVHDDGRMTYIYWPSSGEEAPDENNMIRQWMATVALGRAAAARNEQALWDVVERNIDYNLEHFYEQDGERGYIDYRGMAKLGAMSLAALAILEHPRREKWARVEAGLRVTIDSLWHEDGSFSTFAYPPGRTDQQNYYPGETLLFWAISYAQTKDEAVRERFMKSFEYYRRWHLEPANRNPAFVPWHTQADYSMWVHTRDEALAEFIFEMNDWLIEQMQQWEGDVEYPDTLGRFHNPHKPYGAPHASSTGVYLEGLIDALRLARALGDVERSERYRVAIVRGLRSVMQLQFVDDIDMFYVRGEQRRAVQGGIRTTVYNNVIRCDNVQHNLMGILKILHEFAAEDFVHDR